MNMIGSAFASLAAVLCAGPASAKTVTADGVVIFNQADVDAGGITPGDTPGFPASLLVSGHYRLGSPLTLTSLKNGIVVSAPAVTIDLNGFKVSGAGVGRDGIYTEQIDTTISDGIVRGFTQSGIYSVKGLLTVERVKVTNNGSVGILDGSSASNSRITDSLASGNGYYGVSCGRDCLIQGNTITKSSYGVYVGRGSNVLGNIIADNTNIGLFGIGAAGYGNNTIVGNGTSIGGTLIPLQPNACNPACVADP